LQLVNPSFSKKMAVEAARREIHFVDAPVTGSAPAAAEAKLIFWVGTDPADLGKEFVHCCCAWQQNCSQPVEGNGTL